MTPAKSTSDVKESLRKHVAQFKKQMRSKYKDGWDSSALKDRGTISPEVIAAAFGFQVDTKRSTLTPDEMAHIRASRIHHLAGWLTHCIISASEDLGLTKAWGRRHIRRKRQDSPAEAELRILVKKAIAVMKEMRQA